MPIIPCKEATKGGLIPTESGHPEFTPAMTVKVNVDAAITIAKGGAPKDAQDALERLQRAANALRGVRSPRIARSWQSAILTVKGEIVDQYGLAA